MSDEFWIAAEWILSQPNHDIDWKVENLFLLGQVLERTS